MQRTERALHSRENLRGREARQRCLKLCAMCRRSCTLQENEPAPSSSASISGSTVITLRAGEGRRRSFVRRRTMLQNVLRSKAASSVMGMHVTLMLASAISRTRRLSLHDIVTICTQLLSGARAAAKVAPALVILSHKAAGARVARDDHNLLAAIAHAALVEPLARAPQRVAHVEAGRRRARRLHVATCTTQRDDRAPQRQRKHYLAV